MPRPGMKKKVKPNPKPNMTRIKTVWITEPTEPFSSHYRLGKQIGQPGQFGKAHLCQDKRDNKVYAVKLVSKSRFYRLDRDPKRRQALLMAMKGEIDIMKRLKHKYIVNLKGVYEDKHVLSIVMECCYGGELFDRITARKRFKEKDAAPILKQILEALYYMHDHHKVVHCDLKPDNILFVNKKEDSDIKIIDFGMSKVLPRLRSLRELCGTPYYTAPEILQGKFAYEADLWSVGVIMFVMLFGFPPFYVPPNENFGSQETQRIYELIKKGFTPKVKNGYGPWFPKRFPISEEARDLMSKLIESDRAQRLTASEALQHTWIKHKGIPKKTSTKTNSNEEKEKEDEINEIQFHELAKFTNSCNFKLAIIQLFRGQFEKMRPQQFKDLKNIFKKLDKNGDGKISYDEFEEGMLQIKSFNLDKNRLKEMFKELDVKSVGEIKFDELLNAAIHDYLVSSDERLYQAFRELDTDEDGIITIDELKQKLKETDPYGHYKEILQVIDDADLNKDNKINYEEFLRALHPNFNEQPSWFWDNKKDKKDKQKEKE